MLPSDIPAAIAVLAKTPEEFEACLPSLYLDIALDGQILYDPSGYATDRLATLRRLIEEAGLYRERTEAGDMWEWEREPTGPGLLSGKVADELPTIRRITGLGWRRVSLTKPERTCILDEAVGLARQIVELGVWS